MSRTIVITGASTGIGAECARRLAPGNTLILHYNQSRPEIDSVAEAVQHAGGQAYIVQSDLSSEQGTHSLFEGISKLTDTLDVLLNNAGSLVERQEATALTWDLMERSFGLNVFSPMMLSSLCLPLLNKGTDPSIIFMTSIAMRHGAPTATIYGAAKSALDSATRGLAKELAPAIRVNAVAPGVIETPFHDRFSSPERMEYFRQNTPLQVNGQVHHIAQAVDMLINNDFITGETIDVNGGLFMR
jgi:3-oxoacyl-[acyl-carrier protein] reductase